VFVFTVALLPAAMLLASGRSRAVALTSATGFVVGLVVIVAAVPTAGVTAGSVGFLAGSCTSLAALGALAVGRRVR
jgi:O-antigen/teichoic acid export membrane protein